MGRVRVGTVGYNYRDWAGLFYPAGTHQPRRQLTHYLQHFDACELSQFTHQMPEHERIAHFAAQLKNDALFFVRLHNTFTHCADVGLALTVAKHFKKALEPLIDAGRFGGFVAAFPYAFKNTVAARDYVSQLSHALRVHETPMQLDFRHPTWLTPESFQWMAENNLGCVCVDEPALPGLLPPIVVSTAHRVFIRLHGRNANAWWSGNATTRFDYSYSEAELAELKDRYAPLIRDRREVCFLFQNHWQAQSAFNALRWKQLVASAAPQAIERSASDAEVADDDALRPPTSLPLSEVKSRVSRAFFETQVALDLPYDGQNQELQDEV